MPVNRSTNKLAAREQINQNFPQGEQAVAILSRVLVDPRNQVRARATPDGMEISRRKVKVMVDLTAATGLGFTLNGVACPAGVVTDVGKVDPDYITYSGVANDSSYVMTVVRDTTISASGPQIPMAITLDSAHLNSPFPIMANITPGGTATLIFTGGPV